MSYEELTLRNNGYVTDDLQRRIRTTRILVAGCGIGSTFAETAVRLGFEHLVLVDGDTVSSHNLNRQNFTHADIGRSKVDALADRLRAINPNSRIEAIDDLLNLDNAAELVSRADLVFDTIDFLDIVGITALHDEARRQSRPLITALAIGWGGGCLYFPAGGRLTFRQMFGLPEEGSVANESYVARFSAVLVKLRDHLDPQVIDVVAQALTVMEDGTPCPASQVAPGANTVGALGATAALRIVAGLPVLEAPQLLVADIPKVLTLPGIDLSA